MTRAPAPSSRLSELLAIVERLRAPDGCPWDRQQTSASIAAYAIEEAYEVADAAQRADPEHLKEELGDLLFQVVLHARIAEEAGAFDLDAVAGAICDKLVRRHPLVFGGTEGSPPGGEPLAWEDIKAREREAAAAARLAVAAALTGTTQRMATAQATGAAPLHGPAGVTGAEPPTGAAQVTVAPRTGALAGVPRALPALMRAHKLSQRAARVGFDFEQAEQTADKVAEELAEVREAARAQALAGARASTAVAVPVVAGPSAGEGTPDAASPTGAGWSAGAVSTHDAGPLAGAGSSAGTGPSPRAGSRHGAATPDRSSSGAEPAASREVFEEVGDLLFAAANLARKLKVDPESALRAANDKFERRFTGMEALAARRGDAFGELPLAAQERLWQAVKRDE